MGSNGTAPQEFLATSSAIIAVQISTCLPTRALSSQEPTLIVNNDKTNTGLGRAAGRPNQSGRPCLCGRWCRSAALRKALAPCGGKAGGHSPAQAAAPSPCPIHKPLLQGVLLFVNGLAILNNERFLEKCECELLWLGATCFARWMGPGRPRLPPPAPPLQMAGASPRWATTPWAPAPTP